MHRRDPGQAHLSCDIRGRRLRLLDLIAVLATARADLLALCRRQGRVHAALSGDGRRAGSRLARPVPGPAALSDRRTAPCHRQRGAPPGRLDHAVLGRARQPSSSSRSATRSRASGWSASASPAPAPARRPRGDDGRRTPSHRTGRLERRTAIVGGGEAGEALIRAPESQKDTGLRICGVFDDRNDERSPDLVGGYPKLGTIDDLAEFARRTKLDLVIFTLPISAEARLDHAAQALGAADRHPTLGPYVQAACVRAPIPISVPSRCSTSSTGRSPTGTSS